MKQTKKLSDGRRVLRMLKPYWKWVVADAGMIAIVHASGDILAALSLAWMFDMILPNQMISGLWGLMTLLILGGLTFLTAMVIDEYFCHYVAKTVTIDFKLKLFRHLHKLPFRFFMNNKTGELMARVSDDPDTLHNFLAWEGSTLMSAAMSVVITSGIMFWIHPGLLLISLFLGILFFVCSQWVGAKGREAAAVARKEASRYLERLRESVTGIHLSRVLGNASHEIESARLIRKDFVRASKRELTMRLFSQLTIGSFLGIGVSAIYGIGMFLVIHEEITQGELLMAGALVMTLAWQMRRLLELWLSVRRTGPALDRTDILLSEPTSPTETEKGLILPTVAGEIRFKGVQFTYTEANGPVLKNLSFHIRPGETVALVGPSGSGKSTVTDLLLRLYEPDKGEITIDQVPLQTLDAKWLRTQIAIVSQDIQLRNGSIADNLRLGAPNATEEEMYAALSDAGLKEFVDSLPDGIHTSVGERGSLLSGGQKQRLSLARALIKNAPILILDEASSALDPITENLVNQAIVKRQKQKTILVIAHRLSTVLTADRIIVIEDGMVQEEGTHEELLEQSGVYKRLFQRESEIDDLRHQMEFA